MPQSAESKAYRQLWHDMNRELWRAAADGVPPKTLIRAELWRRVDHTRILEKPKNVVDMVLMMVVLGIFRGLGWTLLRL